MSFVKLVSILLLLAHMAGGAVAQGVTRSAGGILVVDQEALFTGTLYGKRILSDAAAAGEALAAENKIIETTLIDEERELTDRRPTLAAAEFRELADAFDKRVQGIRAEQEAKNNKIGAELDDARRAYFQQIIPILAVILREEGAVAVLDKRTVMISANLIDVTARAIAQIDRQFGDGSSGNAAEKSE